MIASAVVATAKPPTSSLVSQPFRTRPIFCFFVGGKSNEGQEHVLLCNQEYIIWEVDPRGGPVIDFWQS